MLLEDHPLSTSTERASVAVASTSADYYVVLDEGAMLFTAFVPSQQALQ
jgi:hypothetical protein